MIFCVWLVVFLVAHSIDKARAVRRARDETYLAANLQWRYKLHEAHPNEPTVRYIMKRFSAGPDFK